jgi:hypothetical protein
MRLDFRNAKLVALSRTTMAGLVEIVADVEEFASPVIPGTRAAVR